jgi:penicillin-binding protein 2
VGNGGTVYQPRILRKAVAQDGRVFEETRPVVTRKVAVSDENLEILRKAFEGVVNEPGGTGSRARLPGVLVAGKTGTAQVTKGAYRSEEESRIPYEYRDNAWFVAYAPSVNPQIAVAVVVEHGGHGGSTAAPLARRVLAAYFGIEEPPPNVLQASGPGAVKQVSSSAPAAAMPAVGHPPPAVRPAGPAPPGTPLPVEDAVD